MDANEMWQGHKPKPYYDEDGITIYHGDNRIVLPYVLSAVGKSGTAIVTDPPYGIGADRNLRANKRHGNAAVASKDYGAGTWDSQTPPSWMISLLLESSETQIVWGGNYFSLPPVSGWLVWDKDNGDNGYADCEVAWTNITMAMRRLRFRWMGMLQEDMAHKEYRHHPTQKPLSVMSWALSYLPDSTRLIVDPWMGSGTTVVASKKIGIKSIGIEAEERYCEAAALRLSQSVLPLSSDFTVSEHTEIRSQYEMTNGE